MKLDIPNFKTNKELYAFLVENKEQLLSQKKSETKEADGIGLDYVVIKDIDNTELSKDNVIKLYKSTPESLLEKDVIEVKVVINTTNIMDSHKDVHIPGLWDKSLSENKRIMHIQEHKSHEFKSIISSGDDLIATVKNYNWKDLGLNAEGKTQALEFQSKVRKERNEYMFNLYAKGLVDNHSVGMRYVKLVLCINDEDYGAEKEAWDKYYPEIVNNEEADKYGYFWAVTEAKVIEGSAVPNGSNPITPTTSTKRKEDNEDFDTPKMKAIKAFLNK
jgi:hypothetical protein